MAEALNKSIERYYKKLKNPASYSSLSKLYIALKGRFTKAEIKRFLLSQEEVRVLTQAKRKFRRRRILSPHAGYLIQIDTAFMPGFEKDLDKFILAIDTFSKVVVTSTVRSLKHGDVVPTVKSMLKKFPKVERVQTDNGAEYNNKYFRKMLRDLKIHYYTSRDENTKCAIAEAAIKTIKLKLYRYLDVNNTHQWSKALEELTVSYNRTFHRSIKMAPSNVTESTENQVFKNLYESEVARPVKESSRQKKKTFKFKIHDKVKLLLNKSAFLRAWTQKYSSEYYLITDRRYDDGKKLYKIKTILNTTLKGDPDFYEEELLKIYEPSDQLYKIEKVVKKLPGKRVRVRWKGWSEEYDSILSQSELVHFDKARSFER